MITTAKEREDMLDHLWGQIKVTEPSADRKRCRKIVHAFEIAHHGSPVAAQLRLRRLLTEAKTTAHSDAIVMCCKMMTIVSGMIGEGGASE